MAVPLDPKTCYIAIGKSYPDKLSQLIDFARSSKFKLTWDAFFLDRMRQYSDFHAPVATGQSVVQPAVYITDSPTTGWSEAAIEQ